MLDDPGPFEEHERRRQAAAGGEGGAQEEAEAAAQQQQAYTKHCAVLELLPFLDTVSSQNEREGRTPHLDREPPTPAILPQLYHDPAPSLTHPPPLSSPLPQQQLGRRLGQRATQRLVLPRLSSLLDRLSCCSPRLIRALFFSADLWPMLIRR